MTATIQIAHNAVTGKLIGADRQALLETQRILSYRVDGVEHMAAFARGGWDGRSSFFAFTEATFPRGFVHMVKQHLTNCGYKVSVVRKPFPAPLGPEHPVVDDFPEDPRYDYQRHTVDKLLRHGAMIAQVATGGGKSRICKLATARIARPTLFLTTRGVLMYQMAESFASLGKRVAILGDGNIQVSKEVTCGMVQTIVSWLKEPDPEMSNEARTRQIKRKAKMIEVLGMFELVILEEAHEASGNSYYEILQHCKSAHYRLALTATPFMRDSEEANMRLMASSGPIAITVSEQLLIERGILAKPYFKFVTMKEKPAKLYRSTPWQRAYKIGISEFELRNKHIVVECLRAVRYGMSVMVLVQHKEHGKTLNTLMKGAGLRATYIYGEDDQVKRKASLNKLKGGTIDVLIGSTILDVGVDVPAVGMVILAGGGKAEVAMRQRIGRGLREKKNGMPNVAFIVDFADDGNTHLKGHYKQRRSIIESTPGFAENIVEDFDFVGLGFVKRAA